MASAYQPGIPTGRVPLDQDYQNVQGNFQQLDTSFGVDHIPFSGQEENGYHTSIHLDPVSTTVTNAPNNYVPATATPQGVPTATSGFGQLFSCQVNDGISVDETLYWLTGGNQIIPLTRNLTPKSQSNGYTCLPGGLILQWGSVTGQSAHWPSGSTTLTFTSGSKNIAFPNACFCVFTSFIGPTSSSSGDISINSKSALNFVWQFSGSSSSSFDGFYWAAIGN